MYNNWKKKNFTFISYKSIHCNCYFVSDNCFLFGRYLFNWVKKTNGTLVYDITYRCFRCELQNHIANCQQDSLT